MAKAWSTPESIPDEVILPSAADLAAGRDPGSGQSRESRRQGAGSGEAGRLFPIEWRKD